MPRRNAASWRGELEGLEEERRNLERMCEMRVHAAWLTKRMPHSPLLLTSLNANQTTTHTPCFSRNHHKRIPLSLFHRSLHPSFYPYPYPTKQPSKSPPGTRPGSSRPLTRTRRITSPTGSWLFAGPLPGSSRRRAPLRCRGCRSIRIIRLGVGIL